MPNLDDILKEIKDLIEEVLENGRLSEEEKGDFVDELMIYLKKQ